MYAHSRKRKTCMNISKPNLFRHNKINTSYLWASTITRDAQSDGRCLPNIYVYSNYCLDNVCYLNAC